MTNLIQLHKGPRASISKTDLFLQCQWWASPLIQLPIENEEPGPHNERLRFGRAFHKCAEIHLESFGKKKSKYDIIAKNYGIDAKRLEHFDVRFKEFIDDFLKERDWVDGTRLIEQKIAYNPFKDDARYLTSKAERDYSEKKPFEFAGTMDFGLINRPNNQLPVFMDWKSGISHYDAENNGQLRSIGTGMSRIDESCKNGAIVLIVRIDDDFIEPYEAELTAKQFNDHREKLKAAWENASSKNPSMRVGSHCATHYCQALEICPAHVGPLAMRDAMEGVLDPEQLGHLYSRYQAAVKALDRMGDWFQRGIRNNGPFQTDTGKWVDIGQTTKETISKTSIRRGLGLVDGNEVIKQLIDNGCMTSTTSDSLTVRADPSGRK